MIIGAKSFSVTLLYLYTNFFCECVVLSSYYLVCFVNCAPLYWLLFFFLYLSGILQMYRTQMFSCALLVSLPLFYRKFILLPLLPLLFIFFYSSLSFFLFLVHNFQKLDWQGGEVLFKTTPNMSLCFLFL